MHPHGEDCLRHRILDLTANDLSYRIFLDHSAIVVIDSVGIICLKDIFL